MFYSQEPQCFHRLWSKRWSPGEWKLQGPRYRHARDMLKGSAMGSSEQGAAALSLQMPWGNATERRGQNAKKNVETGEILGKCWKMVLSTSHKIVWPIKLLQNWRSLSKEMNTWLNLIVDLSAPSMFFFPTPRSRLSHWIGLEEFSLSLAF